MPLLASSSRLPLQKPPNIWLNVESSVSPLSHMPTLKTWIGSDCCQP